MIGLRLYRLRSDPYPWLDWSAGLLTDEGFYIHNARNVALLGHPRTDEFNNMLLSPLLHFVQVAVFRLLGAGSAQARLIPVACSLVAIALLFAALRRAFGTRVAAFGSLFLGLDHTYLLFNRMALMDTPATLPAVAAFYAFVRSFLPGRVIQVDRRWLTACGALLGITLVSRSLCNYLLPAPFIALYVARRWQGGLRSRELQRDCLAAAAGFVGVMAVYAALWYLPHRAEIMAMNRHYLTKQILPHSLGHLAQNLQHAVFGDTRGITPYLLRHTPVVFLLAIFGLAAGLYRPRAGSELADRARELPDSRPAAPIRAYLAAWLLGGWLLLSVISYSPQRYYVGTYPALAALAALALANLPSIFRALSAPEMRSVRAALAWLAAYHGAELIVHHQGVVPPVPNWFALYVPATAAAALAWQWQPRLSGARLAPSGGHIAAALGAWALFNGVWMGHWLATLDDSLIRTSRWLGANLPPGSVLIGDPAPGVCMDNPFKAILVIKGLCNGSAPIEKFAGSPRYVVVVRDSPVKRLYWNRYYPGILSPRRRIATLHAVRWDVEFYDVPEGTREATGAEIKRRDDEERAAKRMRATKPHE